MLQCVIEEPKGTQGEKGDPGGRGQGDNGEKGEEGEAGDFGTQVRVWWCDRWKRVTVSDIEHSNLTLDVELPLT